MKVVLFLWLLATVVIAKTSRTGIISSSASSGFPGIQFGADGKLSVTVFSDLHLGERELAHETFTNRKLLI